MSMRAQRLWLGLPTIGVAALVAALVPLGATTLLQLSLNDMIQQSTGIVRATVTGTRADYRGSDIYTYYQLSVSEDWRAAGLKPSVSQMEVAVPGGAARGVRQTVAGAPSLRVGQEYVLFLWTSRSGLTQVIGLSQGAFQVQTDSAGNAVLLRPASSEPMVSQGGQSVQPQALSIGLATLRSQTVKTLGTGNAVVQ